jgi:hypothetical protein
VTAWRFIAQRALTGELLDLELPVALKTLRWDLSGPGAFRGEVAPDTGTLRAADGRLLLEEWGTLIYAEADGVIRWGGIVVSSKFEGKSWTVEAAGFTTYPNGLPFTSTYSKSGVDPADVVRDLWKHVQAHTDGDLGVVVEGKTSARVGSDSTATLAAATRDWGDAKSDYDSENAKLKRVRAAETDARRVYTQRTTEKTNASKALTAAKKTKDKAKIAAAQADYDAAVAAQKTQGSAVDAAARATDAQAAVVKSRKATLDAAAKTKAAAKKAEKADGGAYRLNWWESPDVGKEIDDLAQETPFDYVEEHAWSGSKITHTVKIGYPRIGRRRTDLAFVQGDNVVSLVTPSIHGDDFANEVVGLGAGEGKGALRRTTAVRDGRLRRTYLLKEKRVSAVSRMDALVRDELRIRQGELQIDSVDVIDHPNAEIGSWSVGDDVLIQAELPWLGAVSLWCRITSWELTSDSRAKLTLARSDAFTYGG